MSAFNSQAQAIQSAISTFTDKIKTLSQEAQNAETLEGLTLQEVVELIAGTTGLTIQDVLNQLNTHEGRVDNPHSVTATQVGLGNVDNFQTATEPEAAGTVFTYVASDGQTSFTGVGENGNTLALGANDVIYVQKNTVNLPETMFSINQSTSTITLTNAASSDSFTFTAGGGETQLTGDDDSSNTLAIDPGQRITVAKNGTTLTAGTDYTVNPNTNTVNLDVAATSGDTFAITVTDMITVRTVASERFLTTDLVWHVLETFWSNKAGSAPATLDTINEIADALNNNPDVITTIQDGLATKASTTALNNAIDGLTKSSVGLGNVENFGVATEAEALETNATVSTDQKYMTPLKVLKVRQELETQITNATSNSASQTDLNNAIDALTKADIGLGNVDNYATATNDEATGTRYVYNVSAGQTSFSGADNASNTLAIDAGNFVSVELNGAVLGTGAFSVDEATDTVTVSSATDGDSVVIRVFENERFLNPSAAAAYVSGERRLIETDMTSALTAIETAFTNAASTLQTAIDNQ